MAWVVDTCVLIDIISGDPQFGATSDDCLIRAAEDGLALCPVSYIEIAPAFFGDRRGQESFLNGVGVNFTLPWEREDTLAAHAVWSRYVDLKREKKIK